MGAEACGRTVGFRIKIINTHALSVKNFGIRFPAFGSFILAKGFILICPSSYDQQRSDFIE